jgi:hypothetical protein
MLSSSTPITEVKAAVINVKKDAPITTIYEQVSSTPDAKVNEILYPIRPKEGENREPYDTSSGPNLT